MHRRTFLQKSCCALSALAAGCHTSSQDERHERCLPSPCSPSHWQKHGIILEATEPWEAGNVQNFTACAEPEKRGSWRLWYSVSGKPGAYTVAYAEGVPGGPMKKVPAVLSPGEPGNEPLAIGNLPEGWRPVQPVHLRLKNGRERLYFWVHGPQIARYLAAESEDGRRYRVVDPLRPVLYHPNDRAADGVASPDGMMFRTDKNSSRPAGEPLASPSLISNDATNVYQLPDGSFEMYSVGLVRVPQSDPAYVAEDNAPGLLRVIDRYSSEDGLHFANRCRVIQRDTADPVDQQFYYLSVTYTPKGRVGLLGHYRCRAQTMDLEWCFSQDGLHWVRPLREPWLVRGNPSVPDCYGIYAGHSLVKQGGRWFLFYTGVNSSHNGKHSFGSARQVVMLATAESIWT